jgi:hypothetical protein
MTTVRDVLRRPLDPVPLWWTVERGGTIPEYYVYRACERIVGPEYVGFEFEGGFFGGRLVRGGIIPDILIYSPRVGINVQGARFHLPPVGSPANDRLQRAQMEMIGVRMEFIGEAEAINRPDQSVREAIAGTRGRGPLEAMEI